MQVHSIISNTISENILETGNLSIRFMADGFSLLLEDQLRRPVLLNKFSDSEDISLKEQINECVNWLNRNDILANFKGETSLLFDSKAFCIVPKEIYIEGQSRLYLKQVARIKDSDTVYSKKVKGRTFYLIYAIPEVLKSLQKLFAGQCRIFHNSEVVYSVADQVNASDHQRGFVYMDIQKHSMNMLIISDDKVQYSNQLSLKEAEEYLYYCLNTIKQVGLDRRTTPLYYSGICNSVSNSIETLKKYIKKVTPLSYFIHELDKEAIAEHVLLAEATRCV